MLILLFWESMKKMVSEFREKKKKRAKSKLQEQSHNCEKKRQNCRKIFSCEFHAYDFITLKSHSAGKKSELRDKKLLLHFYFVFNGGNKLTWHHGRTRIKSTIKV